MRTKKPNSIVRNIMNGKVVFAKEVASLGKTVIVKHQGSLHTIYANLSKIAPGIKAGQYVRSNTAIGRIEKELKFEVTMDNIPINPIELIRI